MGPVAEALTAEQRRAAAEYYAAIVDAPAPPPPDVDLETLRSGGALAAAGAADREIPPCRSCHGGARRDGIPALAGQFADYMRLQLHLWQTGARAPGADAGVMQRIARRLTEPEIRAVSLYYASLRDAAAELALGEGQRHPPPE
jgi:cytochrome c553